MSRPRVVLVVARADNGVIGRDGGLPWRIRADLAHFRRLTIGFPVIMGRRTFESLPKRLDGRRHIVLTRASGWRAEGVEVAHSIAEALALAGDVERVSVIGGAEIYALFLPVADEIRLTEVHAAPEGDTFMPAPAAEEWEEVSREAPSEPTDPGIEFVTLRRRPGARQDGWK